MSNEDRDRRVIGITAHDELIGRMIEKATDLSEQYGDMKRAIEVLNISTRESTELHRQTRETLIHLNVTVEHLGQMMDNTNELETRLRSIETKAALLDQDIRDAKEFKAFVLKWGIIVAIATISGSSTVGPLLLHWVKVM